MLFIGPHKAIVHLTSFYPFFLLPVHLTVIEIPLRPDHNIFHDRLSPVLKLIKRRVCAMVEEILATSISLLLFFFEVSMGQNHVQILFLLFRKVLLLAFGRKSLLLYHVILSKIEQLVSGQIVVISWLRWLHYKLLHRFFLPGRY